MDTLLDYREQIFARVHELIAANGYHGFQFEEVATQVGIDERIVLHYFPHKALLVKAFVADEHALTDVWIQNVVERTDDPLLQLQRYTREWAKSLKGAHGRFYICALLASELPGLPEEVANEVRRYFNAMSSWIASVLEFGKEQQRIRLACPPDMEAKMFMATIQGAILSARVHADERIFNEIAALQLRRITHPSTA